MERGDTITTVREDINRWYGTQLTEEQIMRRNALRGAADLMPGRRILLPDFATQDYAATAALLEAAPRSMAENVEYGGWIYRLPEGRGAYGTGGYNYTRPTRGTGREANPREWVPIPVGTGVAGDYHTHGDYARVVGRRVIRSTRELDNLQSDRFSPNDIRLSEIGGRRVRGYRSYLATPSADFWVYVPRSTYTHPNRRGRQRLLR